MNRATHDMDIKRLAPRQRIATEFAQHPMAGATLFYTLPSDLLFHLRALGLAIHHVDPDFYRLERVMAYLVAKERGSVGRWNCQPVRYRFPQPPTSGLVGEDADPPPVCH